MSPLSIPDVSIIMPAYNAERFIGTAIDSVIAQTFQNWELIIVDDASTDATFHSVGAYQKNDTRIRCVRNDTNLGAAGTRNHALELARGRYIAFLDSDDFWTPSKLALQIAFMDASATPITYGDYLRINEQGGLLGRVRAPRAVSYKDLLRSNFIGNLTGIYRRACLPDLRFERGGHEDYLFWLKALRQVGEIQATPSVEPLAYYRVAANSLSGNKVKALRWQWDTYRCKLGLSVASSAYYFSCYIFYALRKRLFSH